MGYEIMLSQLKDENCSQLPYYAVSRESDLTQFIKFLPGLCNLIFCIICTSQNQRRRLTLTVSSTEVSCKLSLIVLIWIIQLLPISDLCYPAKNLHVRHLQIMDHMIWCSHEYDFLYSELRTVLNYFLLKKSNLNWLL